MVCEICAREPGSHSLREIGVSENGEIVFYTCPSQGKKYNDYDGIMKHYDETLGERLNDHSSWIWVFDSKGFGIKHLLEVRIAIGIATLLKEKYSTNLQKIIVLKGSLYIDALSHIVYPFIGKKLQDLIEFI
jgi:hypothetical protein